ncbi:MerR family transcriptional regulator [Marinobacteraceae bacterium S3BR75-40.1]
MNPSKQALALLYNRLFAGTPTDDAESDDGEEYTVDELARVAGTTVRNVRAYQDRGLLPPPERRGRVGVYSGLHLSRLRLISNLLKRGYGLGNIKEMVSAWEKGGDLGDLLGLEQAITSPWTNEAPSYITREEMRELFAGTLTDDNLTRAIELDLVQPVRDGYRLKQPRLFNAGAELVRLGIPLDDLFDVLVGLRANVEKVATDLVQLAARMIDRYQEDIPPKEDMPKLADLIWQLRPLAMVAVESEVQRAMEQSANKYLMERVSRLFQNNRHLAETVVERHPSRRRQDSDGKSD